MKFKKSVICLAVILSSVTSANVFADDTCDIGKIHEEVFDKFKLPDIPSSLEDCGIGGFLNFDFSFDFGDVDLSSLFCDFAKDVMGDFKKSMKVDFKLGTEGLKVNSPIYSVNTGGIDEMTKGLIYDATGVTENAPGVLDKIGKAYEGSLSAMKDAKERNTYETRTGNGNNSTTGTNSAFATAVRNGSAVNMSDMDNNLKALENINTIASGNTNRGNTNFRNLRGASESISIKLNNVNLTGSQQANLETLPERSLASMTEEQLADFLGLSEAQKINFGMITPPTVRPSNTRPNVNYPANLYGVSEPLTLLLNKVRLSKPQTRLLKSTDINVLRGMNRQQLIEFMRFTDSQLNQVNLNEKNPSLLPDNNERDVIDRDLIDALFN